MLLGFQFVLQAFSGFFGALEVFCFCNDFLFEGGDELVEILYFLGVNSFSLSLNFFRVFFV
jgi:hypothetical protein